MVITIADHRTRVAHGGPFPYFYWAACSTTLLFALNAGAADWKIQPTTQIRETYSDNIKLATQGSEKSDWVTEITPGVSIIGTGRDLNVHVNYAMQNLVYANNSNANTIQNQLNADAHAVLADDLFYWDGRASISQQDISPLGAQTNDNVNDTGNRARVTTYTFSPYLRHHFGSTAVGELRYSRDDTRTNTALVNTNTDTALFKLDSGTAFRTVGWGLQANDQKIGYTNNEQVEMRMASANVSYRVTPRFSLIETVGYEKNSYAWAGGDPAGRLWSSGFSWSPTDRTSISASAGRRFYGPTYSLSSSVRSRSTIWSLGYAEDITTTQAQFSQDYTANVSGLLAPYVAGQYYSSPEYANTQIALTPAALQALVNNFMLAHGMSNANSSNFFTNRIFLQKKLQGLAVLNSGKSSFMIGGYYTVRIGQTTSTLDDTLYGTFNSSTTDKTKEAGVNLQWNWRVFSRTTSNLGADYIRTSAPVIGARSDLKRVTLALTKKIQPKLDGSVGYRHVLQKSNQVIGPITEDAVFASLLMRF